MQTTDASWTKQPASILFQNWEPMAGDHLVVDVDNNMGYLIHPDGRRLLFPVATGQQNYVSYIGKRYFAATPKQEWVVKEKSIKGDRITFGKGGRFFRMYADDQRTSYGIHSVSNAKEMMAWDNRYKSMGCTLVTEEILDIIEKTFEINGEELRVKTI